MNTEEEAIIDRAIYHIDEHYQAIEKIHAEWAERVDQLWKDPSKGPEADVLERRVEQIEKAMECLLAAIDHACRATAKEAK